MRTKQHKKKDFVSASDNNNIVKTANLIVRSVLNLFSLIKIDAPLAIDAPEKNNVLWSDFCGQKVHRGQKFIKDS